MRLAPVLLLLVLMMLGIETASAQQRRHHHSSSPPNGRASRPPPDAILQRLECPVCESTTSYLTTVAALQYLQCRQPKQVKELIDLLTTQWVLPRSELWDTEQHRQAVALRSVLLSYVGLEPSWVFGAEEDENRTAADEPAFYLEQPAGRGKMDAALERVPLVLASKETGELLQDSCSLTAFDAIVRYEGKGGGDAGEDGEEVEEVMVPAGSSRSRPLPRATTSVAACWDRMFDAPDRCPSNLDSVTAPPSSDHDKWYAFVTSVWRNTCGTAVVLSFPAVENPIPKGDDKEHWDRSKRLAQQERGPSMSSQVESTLQTSCSQVLHNAFVSDRVQRVVTEALRNLEIDSSSSSSAAVDRASKLATDLYAAVVTVQDELCQRSCRLSASERGRNVGGGEEGAHDDEGLMRRPRAFPKMPTGTAFNALGGRVRLHLRHLAH